MLDFLISLISLPATIVDSIITSLFHGISEVVTMFINGLSIIGFIVLAKIFLSAEYRMKDRQARREMRRTRNHWF
ncbi:hypothetical protein [Photobacterium damselae]|uniref:hypothetical protein n=1 Tax=Photobacterium damselae TaxID=38293 RepID=UPI004068E6F3